MQLVGLKAAMMQRRLSQRETSRLSAIGENRLSSIVNGWINPNADERRRLAAVLHQAEQVLFDANARIEIRTAR